MLNFYIIALLKILDASKQNKKIMNWMDRKLIEWIYKAIHEYMDK